MHFFRIAVLICLYFSYTNCQSKKFDININSDGSYGLLIKGNEWLSSADTFMRSKNAQYDTNSKTLVLQNVLKTEGTDILGDWKASTFVYSLNNEPSIMMNCNIIKYNDLNIVRFIQEFPNGSIETAVPNTYHQVSTSFPSFKIKKIENETIGYLSFGGMMAGDMEKTFGDWTEWFPSLNSGPSAGPLILFNTEGDSLVISQMNEFMATSAYHNFKESSYHWGIMSGVNEIPEYFSCDFIVYYSDNGINKAMEGWGKQLQIFHKKDLSYKENDITQNYLSYWTDNGAYYYFLTEANKTYQDTVFDIMKYYQEQDIPMRSFQYDSWWYNRRNSKGALIWDGNAPTEAFPNSMQYIYNETKMPVTGHNKFWDSHVAYAKKNGGDYDFIIDETNFKALPNEERFWDDLFSNSSKWGLVTYEQDWMDAQTLEFVPLMTNISLGKKWLKDMGNAALKHNITIQYCMSLSRHILSSLENNAVTQARVTNDYATNWNYLGQQWRIGVSAMFSSNIGLSVFKDVFWTTSDQPGNKNGNIPDGKAREPYPELNAVVSTLSGGPVGPGDKIGLNYTNKTLIMRSCSKDGLLLKPTKGITALDQQIYFKAFGEKAGINGEVSSAYSIVSGFTFGILLAVDVNGEYKMDSNNLGFKVQPSSYFWKDGSNENVYKLNGFENVNELTIDKACSKKDFCLYHVTPHFSVNGNDVAILGEQSKWVPISPKRLVNINFMSESLQLIVNGSVNEQIEFSFLINDAYRKVSCHFENTTKKMILVNLPKDKEAQIAC